LATPFRDRADAGRKLAARVRDTPLANVVVLALPRGGVPVAAAVAHALAAPLDIIMVRKLGVPRQPELAMGAIGEGGVRILNAQVIAMAHVSNDELAIVEAREREELARRATRFRGTQSRVVLTGRTALVVDDGIATGATMRAACQVARAGGAARVVVATPVAPPATVARLRDVADEVIALEQPKAFFAIGEFYDNFAQTSDEEVVQLLRPGPEGPPVLD
jgi:putative phosphoribosyl transferase